MTLEHLEHIQHLKSVNLQNLFWQVLIHIMINSIKVKKVKIFINQKTLIWIFMNENLKRKSPFKVLFQGKVLGQIFSRNIINNKVKKKNLVRFLWIYWKKRKVLRKKALSNPLLFQRIIIWVNSYLKKRKMINAIKKRRFRKWKQQQLIKWLRLLKLIENIIEIFKN